MLRGKKDVYTNTALWSVTVKFELERMVVLRVHMIGVVGRGIVL